MKEQFEAISDDGMLTKDRLRAALRLSECPRIDTLVDCRLFDRPDTVVTGKPPTGSISVTDFIAFIISGNCSVPLCPLTNGNIASSRQLLPTPCSPIPLATTQSLEKIGCQNRVSGSRQVSRRTPMEAAVVTDGPAKEADERPRDNAGVGLWCSNVVPVTLRSTLSAVAAERGGAFVTVTRNQGGRGERLEQRRELISSRPTSGGVSGASSLIGRQHTSVTASASGSTPCREIVRHLGTVVGLWGKDGYRRPGPAQPVWRKRETLVQERIVQYTTLDEEGMFQELVETEKSQTEVLHMECKRTAEFAHRESTYYETGEAFNGEVIAEEAGAEHYVHFRSVDDEYEFLESTLPPRARHGDAAATGNAGEGRSGGDEDAARASGGNYPAGVEGETDKEEEEEEEVRGNGARHRCVDSSSDGGNNERKVGTVNLSARRETGVVGDGYVDENVSLNLGGGDGGGGGMANNASVASGCGGRVDSGGEGVDEQQSRAPFSPSAYHYRSPMCSPRLSPRPTRSPYRQEGVGRRETAERRKHGRSRSRGRGSELPVEMEAEARGQTIAVEEGASIDDPMRAHLGRSMRREELEPITGFFAQEQNQDTKETKPPCVSGLPSVELPEGLTPRRFTAPEGSLIDESKSDDGDCESLGCDRVEFFFSPFEPRAESGPPWSPLPDDTVASGADIDDSERMKENPLLFESGSGGDFLVPMKACFDGHHRGVDHGVGAGHDFDGNGWRHRDDSSGSSGGSEYSSAGDDDAPAGLPTGGMASP